MNKDIKNKNVIFYSIFLMITIILIDIFIKPNVNFRLNFVNELIQRITTVQNIAPQRLFIKVWRITKNLYIDDTLNNQDWQRWKLRYIRNIKTLEDANVAINSMLLSLNDPYCKFLLSNVFKKQKIILDSEVSGIGILFDKTDNNVVINHILDNSPAQSANILPGDIIVSINNKEISDFDTNKVSEFIEDADDKNIILTIKRNNEIITKKVIKTNIPIKTMAYKITKDNIGIITLYNIMGKKAVEDFRESLIITNDTRGLIIDLRNNFGGILANAIEMANMMLDNQEMISIESRTKNRVHIYADNEKIFKNKPIIILINNKTASAAEVLAGILKNDLNALLIGERTYGKNSIQQIIPMPNDTGLIITSDKYIMPDGEDIYKKGIKPDIKVTEKTEKYAGNDMSYNKALELMRKLILSEEISR